MLPLRRKRLRACTSTIREEEGEEEVAPDIPHDVIATRIFSTLPVTNVYAVTILSKRFRNAWEFCPDIVLDRSLSSRVSLERYKVMVADIISGHSGIGARTFQLYFNPVDNEELVKAWLHRLDTLGFREIYLYFQSDKLTSLNLRSCGDAQLSDSLPNLLNLTLQDITISQQLIDAIFAACNSLHSLKLIDCENKEEGDLQFRAQSLEGLREIVFEQCGSTKRLHSIFINSPPSLNCIRFSKDNFSVIVRMVPPLLGDAAVVSNYDRLSRSVNRKIWLDSEASSGYLLLPRFAVKGLMPVIGEPTVSAEEYHRGSPLWEARRFHMHYPLWNVEEFHLHAKCHPVDYFAVMMFLPRCRMIRKVYINFAREEPVTRSEGSYESVDRALYMPVKFELLNYVKITGYYSSTHQYLLLKFLVKTSKRCLRDFIVIKAKGSSCCVPSWWRRVRCYNYDSFPSEDII